MKLMSILGLVSLFPVNSTTYSTVSLAIAGVAVALALFYLLTSAPASFQSQSQSQFRGFQGKLEDLYTYEKNVKTLFQELLKD